MSFGVCTGLLEIHEKPPMAGECILSKDGTALFFFSCGEWDLTAMLNVLAHFYCASVSTYWQAQVMWENKSLIWSECWALCYKKNFQPNFRIQKISLFCLQEAPPFFPLNKILSKFMLSFFSHVVLSFMFIYLECCQDCRYLKILLNGRKRLQLWRKYNKTKYLFWPLSLLFWRRKAEQRCLRDCLADLALAQFMTCQSLGVTHLPGSGDVSAKGKVTLLVQHML